MRLFSFVSIVATALLAAGVRYADGQPTVQGADQIFQARCAACHSLSRAIRPLRAVNESDRRTRLETFLVDHHLSDEAERTLLVEYLLAAAAK